MELFGQWSMIIDHWGEVYVIYQNGVDLEEDVMDNPTPAMKAILQKRQVTPIFTIPILNKHLSGGREGGSAQEKACCQIEKN